MDDGTFVSRNAAASVRPDRDHLLDAAAAATGARFGLFEAELQKAAWTAALISAMAVAAGLLGVTAWLVVAASLVFGATKLGVAWWAGSLVVVALHLLAAYLLLRRVRTAVRSLSFARSRDALTNVFDREPARSP